MAAITHYRLGTWKPFFKNLITVWCKAYNMVAITSKWNLSIQHGCYHPLQIRNSELLQELDNYDGARPTTQSLLPQKGMWEYSTAAITSKGNVSIQHGRYLPLQMWTWDFFRNLIIVMVQGVRYSRYYLKKGCEHMAQLLSPIADRELRTSSGTW